MNALHRLLDLRGALHFAENVQSFFLARVLFLSTNLGLSRSLDASATEGLLTLFVPNVQVSAVSSARQPDDE